MSEKIFFTQGGSSIFVDSDDDNKRIETIKSRIKEMFNMKNINFLFGSGTSVGAIPTMNGLYNSVLDRLKAHTEKKHLEEFLKIEKRIKTKKNLEDILGVLYSYRIYQKDNFDEKENDKNDELKRCSELIDIIEDQIFNEINIEISDSKYLSFLKLYQTFYLKLALRNKDLSRLNIFTTNNDLFNEYALDSTNIHYINGFSRGINRYFNPALFNYTYSKRMDTSIEKFEPVENMVYLYKIHGSINWIEDDTNSNSFFNIKETYIPKREKDIENILIYPTPTKQNKSLGSPYVELFREFQKKLLEPHTILFVIGYSFSDEHVNNIIYQALATNSTINLVIFGEISNKIIEIADNRIINIYGEYNGERINYFNYIVNNLLPNIDAFKSQDNLLNEFINSIKVK
ncbi:SIR2 family protein [uncultured Chryseobacterium sp.]|uniref:SIR2 family protein n=1 Tax=uncultured Chryseobacterium sp. TaxID=259322 RepID=UPI0025890896|nr:SIR2 family protein [uncultured Chryseobacterium sp.]